MFAWNAEGAIHIPKALKGNVRSMTCTTNTILMVNRDGNVFATLPAKSTTSQRSEHTDIDAVCSGLKSPFFRRTDGTYTVAIDSETRRRTADLLGSLDGPPDAVAAFIAWFNKPCSVIWIKSGQKPSS